MARRPAKDTPSETTPKANTHSASASQPSIFSNGRGWLYGFVGLLILIVVFIAGISAAAVRHNNDEFVTAMHQGPEKLMTGPRHTFGSYGSTAQSGQSRLSGVVTSVNGSGFTVAGHGSATNVTTNGSTQYQGGDQVKQNDSVIIWGTENNGTITATQIEINP